jgi:response regulator RpfG family c-di-GMP phosphodiesterase
VAVASAYDQLMSGAGPEGMPSSVAVGTLAGSRSQHFDPDVLRALEAVAPQLASAAA